MTTKTRRLLAFIGPTVAGATFGIASATYGGGGEEFIVQLVVGAAIGVILMAFVPEDRR